MKSLKNYNRTFLMIHIDNGEMVAIETIKKCRRVGNYTEIWIWGEDSARSIWDESQNLWVNIETANRMVWDSKQVI